MLCFALISATGGNYVNLCDILFLSLLYTVLGCGVLFELQALLLFGQQFDPVSSEVLMEVLTRIDCSWNWLERVAAALAIHLPDPPASFVEAYNARSIMQFGEGLVLFIILLRKCEMSCFGGFSLHFCFVLLVS